MQYNIYFDLVSLFFDLVILLFFQMRYTREQGVNRIFPVMLVSVSVQSVFDIVSSLLIMYPSACPVWVSRIALCGYFCSAVLIPYLMTIYVNEMVKGSRRGLFATTNMVVLGVYEASQILNVFWGFYYRIGDKGEYIKGPIFMVTVFIPVIYILTSMVYMIVRHKALTAVQVRMMFIYISVVLVGFVLQTFITTSVMLVCFAESIALLMLLFALETPDYEKMIQTMKELEEARDEAQRERLRTEEANAAKSRFLANVSHEIRTPINAILGMDEMILRESKENATLGYATDIKNFTSSLLSTINEVLDLSKIESGKVEILPVDYKLEDLIHNVEAMMRIRVEDKGLTLVVNVDSELPCMLHGDDLRIRQILINLMTNAVKYTVTGSVELRVTGVIRSGACRLRFEVIDTGVGIKEEDRDKLYTEFSRIDEKANRNIEGTGLGITITQQLLTLMGSHLELKSEYGKGSTFSFELAQKVVNADPVGEIAFGRDTRESLTNATSNLRLKQSKVLLVDDSHMNARVFRNLLKNSGLEIDAVDSGFACLENIQKERYDLIFMDHLMPGMNGIETFHEMQKREKNLCKDTPVVMLTANAIEGAREEFLQEGFTDFLSKPVLPEQLEAMLRKYLPNS